MTTTVRAELEKALAPFIKQKRWVLRRWQLEPDAPTKLTVVLKQESIQPHDTAPIAQHLTNMTIVLVSPQEDLSRAEDELDVQVLELIEQLQKLPIRIQFIRATKGIFAGRFAAYDITTEIDSEK